MSTYVNHPARALDRTTSILGRLLLGFSLLFLLLPAILIVVLSFGTDPRVRFPPEGWGLDRYVDVFTSGSWGGPLLLSLEVALYAAVGTLVVALPLVFAANRSRLPGRSLLEGVAIAPVVIPISAYAVGMYAVFAELDLIGTQRGVVLAHITHALPLVVIVLSTSLEQIRTELELAAMTMGATRLRAWGGITLRLLLPAVVSGFLFGFISSFDEAVLITFLGGSGLVTLPKYIFDSVQYSVDPAITAIATLLMFAVTFLMLLSSTLRRKEGR
ncbi:ABC transporter permease [Nocardioides caldifontis]|uniref:ABC transporter permease n=1 Tax=Nocardioides caldifontis TaxID=2588938 RepID=UPI0011DFE23B|nr:ABC transporter permease [Nocardioides caldifontis]